MATRVKVTYVAIDYEKDGYKPLTTASTFEDLRLALDEYYAVGRGEAECLGFFPYNSKYPDDYEGYYEYRWRMPTRDGVEEYTDTVKVYCLEYYPHTVYEINK